MLEQMLQVPVDDVRLLSGEVHLWGASLSENLYGHEELEQTLSREERAKSEQFRFDGDRVRYVAGLGILRLILGRYLNIEPGLIEFGRGRNGKPTLSNRHGRNPIRFNMSRSKGFALYAFSRDRELGVDVEKIDAIPDMDQIVERFFSKREIQEYYRIPASGRTEAFFRCWTRKEAVLKALGEGLYQPLDSFSVPLLSSEKSCLIVAYVDQKNAQHWQIHNIDVGDRFTAALAVEHLVKSNAIHSRNIILCSTGCNDCLCSA